MGRKADRDRVPASETPSPILHLTRTMPPRTRACSVCRKKRIKCDGTLPHCLMCQRTGKVCPGPLKGPLIVDMTAKVTGMKRRQKTGFDLTHGTTNTNAHHIEIGPLVLTATTTSFFENFLGFFTTDGESKDIQNQLTWLQRIPQLVSSRSDRALILALEATATAYGGIMTSNTNLTRQAHELYGTALRAHQAVLQQRGSSSDITVHLVSTSVMLSFFEAMQATTADAYRAHIYGAARLFEITGSGECGFGVLCQLFYHVRTQMLFIQLATDSYDVPLSAKRILYDTLQYSDPPMIQKLMCCITALHDLQTPNEEAHGSRTKKLVSLESGVEELWREYSSQKSTGSAVKTESFDDAFTALTVAYFSAARILIGVLSADGGGFPESSQHAQVILDATSFLDTSRNAIAYMRVATPLLLVALYSGCGRHRMSAMGVFEGWAKGSMRGISALALDTVSRRNVAS